MSNFVQKFNLLFTAQIFMNKYETELQTVTVEAQFP